MDVTEDQKHRMIKNLNRSFELLKVVTELRVAYLKKMHPDKTETELIQKMHADAIEAKERQWESQRI